MALSGELELRLKVLMIAGLAGDPAAHGALLKALAEALRRYYGRRLSSPADVEDLVQETLIAVHSRRATYQPSAPFTAWAYAIARYKLIDFYRRSGRRLTAPLEAADALFADGEDADAWTAAADLERLLAELDPRSAALIRHTRIQGLSVQETAALTGMSESAVKVAIHRGLKKLGAKYGGGDVDG